MDNIRENLLFSEKKYEYVFSSLIYNNNHHPNITSENCPDKSSKKGDAIISTTVPPSMNIPEDSGIEITIREPFAVAF